MPLEAKSPRAVVGGGEGATKRSGLSLKVSVFLTELPELDGSEATSMPFSKEPTAQSKDGIC